MAKIVLKNPGRALDFPANFAIAVASRNFEAALAVLLEVTNFYPTGKGLSLGNYV